MKSIEGQLYIILAVEILLQMLVLVFSYELFLRQYHIAFSNHFPIFLSFVLCYFVFFTISLCLYMSRSIQKKDIRFTVAHTPYRDWARLNSSYSNIFIYLKKRLSDPSDPTHNLYLPTLPMWSIIAVYLFAKAAEKYITSFLFFIILYFP